jgi:CheY-like chemotaxis protein
LPLAFAGSTFRGFPPNGSWERPVPSDDVEVVVKAGASKPTSILIVEDEALVASYIEEVLAESGFRVAGIAASGPEALSLAEETRPRLALVDIRLTGPIDGIELACVLRQKLGIPAIFLSGLADDETTHRAQLAKPLGFLRKPFRPSQVFNAIERALSEAGS